MGPGSTGDSGPAPPVFLRLRQGSDRERREKTEGPAPAPRACARSQHSQPAAAPGSGVVAGESAIPSSPRLSCKHGEVPTQRWAEAEGVTGSQGSH